MIGFVGLRLSRSFTVFVVAYIILICSSAALTLTIRATRTALCKSDELGKVTGAMIFINSCSYPIGGLLIYLMSYEKLGLDLVGG